MQSYLSLHEFFIIMEDVASKGQPYPKTVIGALHTKCRTIACLSLCFTSLQQRGHLETALPIYCPLRRT